MDRTKTALPLVDEAFIPSDSQAPVAETPFLFVNETTSSPSFKLGGRQDIRSHVRKNVARRFRQTHKALHKEEPEGIRHLVLAPHRAATAESVHAQRCEHLLGRSSVSQIVREHSKPSFALENWKESKTSSVTAPTPDNTVPSDFQSTPTVTNQSYASPLPTISFDSILSNDTQIFCPTCGSRISSKKMEEIEGKKTNLIATRTSQRGLFNYSPVEALGSGRVDPFLSYPVETPTPQLHQLMDHAVTYLLPGLVPDGENRIVNPVSKAWFSTGLQHPLVFHALIFAGSIHLDFLRTSKIFPNSPQALSHKLVVIQKLKEIMNDPQKACRDEVILAILVLSSHESMDHSRVRVNPFNSPLRSAQWLNIYGNITYVPEHMKAMLDLITWRGGLDKLELYGLAEVIAAGDVLSSTQSISKPILPPLKVSEVWITTVLTWATSSPRLPTLKLGRGFLSLQDFGLTETAIFVLDSICALTVAIDHYLEGEPAGLSLGAISRTRTAVQHRLLSLPAVDDLENSSLVNAKSLDVYEACRLTALIYGVAVIFPIPNSYNVLQQLVQRLKESLEFSVKFLRVSVPDLLLWMLLLGGIAALEKPERTWYVARLADLAKRRAIYDWEIIEDKMVGFLWLESACGAGGRRLWSEVMERF